MDTIHRQTSQQTNKTHSSDQETPDDQGMMGSFTERYTKQAGSSGGMSSMSDPTLLEEALFSFLGILTLIVYFTFGFWFTLGLWPWYLVFVGVYGFGAAPFGGNGRDKMYLSSAPWTYFREFMYNTYQWFFGKKTINRGMSRADRRLALFAFSWRLALVLFSWCVLFPWLFGIEEIPFITKTKSMVVDKLESSGLIKFNAADSNEAVTSRHVSKNP